MNQNQRINKLEEQLQIDKNEEISNMQKQIEIKDKIIKELEKQLNKKEEN